MYKGYVTFTMIRIFHFSSKVVGGYQVRVNLDDINTIRDIEQICTAQMLQFLTDNNLMDALLEVENRKFHIHDLTMEEIKNPENMRMLYICDMCEG